MRWILVALLLGGCALGGEVPVVEVAPASPGGIIVQESVPVIPSCPIERVEVALLPRGDRVVFAAPAPKPTGSRHFSDTHRGLQAVAQAQTLARQEPQAGQYVGGELVYPWVAGQVYTIYLSPTKGTGIFLAPGDVLVKGLFLNPEAFEVTTQRAGVGDDAFDALVIRPTQPSGDAEAFLLTTSGRRYYLRFVVGKQGMLAVTFTAPRLARPQIPIEEPRGRDPDVSPLILPKPPA